MNPRMPAVNIRRLPGTKKSLILTENPVNELKTGLRNHSSNTDKPVEIKIKKIVSII